MELILIPLLAALLIGLSKGGLGGPIPGTLSVPLLSLIMPVSKAAGLALPLLIVGDVFALYFYRGKWDWRYIRLMLPAGIIGIILGTLLLAMLPDEVMRPLLGIFTLIVIIYKLLNDYVKSIRYTPQNWHGYLAGWASGFGSALANSGAPPFTAYMLLQPGMLPMTFMGTATLFFAALNLLKVPGFLTSGVLDVPQFLSIAWILPLIPIGVWLGRKSLNYINPKVFERVMLVLLFILSLSLIF